MDERRKGKLRIEMTGHGEGRVWIDDEEIHGVVSIEFKAHVGDANTVVLRIQADHAKITGPARVVVFK